MNKSKLFNVQKLPQPLILFDGVCNLCQASVQFILENDTNAHFYFASLQSAIGQAILKQFNFPLEHFDSVLLLEKGVLYSHSTAACLIAQKLSTRWRYAGHLMIIPKVVRDFGYRLIAKNRYRFWGKKEQCWLPTPEFTRRFLGQGI